MPYESAGIRRFWSPDLSTRVGAESAMDSAKFCFLIVAGFRVLTYAILLLSGRSVAGINPLAATVPVLVAIAAIDVGLPLLAAWRLHVYKGAFAVPIVTALYALGILASLNPAGIVIGALFTAVSVGGIRGAWAVRRNTGFEDDYYGTFN